MRDEGETATFTCHISPAVACANGASTIYVEWLSTMLPNGDSLEEGMNTGVSSVIVTNRSGRIFHCNSNPTGNFVSAITVRANMGSNRAGFQCAIRIDDQSLRSFSVAALLLGNHALCKKCVYFVPHYLD